MTIKFNNSTYNVQSFNKTTYLSDDRVSSNGSCTVSTNDADSLYAISEDGIETIQIYNNDNELIYNSTNLNGKITTIEEYLNGQQINVNLQFIFE